MKTNDDLSKLILKILNSSQEPLETEEVINLIKNSTRTKVLYRLNNLRGEGKIRAKSIGSGKGTWIWWKMEAFKHE